MAISYVDSATGYLNSGTSVTATLPAGAQAGDVVLAFGALSDVTLGDPSISGGGGGGTWTQLGSTTDDNTCRTKVWRRVVVSGDPGATISMSWTSSGKGGLILDVYRGVDTTTPVDGTPATEAETGTDTTHNAPGVTPSVANCWVVEYVAQRSSACTTITAPGSPSRTKRAEQLGFGAGTVCQIVADSAAAVTQGVASGSATYTFDISSANAVGWSIALRPASTGVSATAGRVTGTGTARPVTAAKALAVGRASGTGTARAVTTTQLHVLGRATGTGEALPVTVSTEGSGESLFPALSIQAAFSAGASTATMLTLDDPTRGHLDVGTLGDGTDAEPTWVELADRATEGTGSIVRGSQRIDSPIVQYDPGVLSVPLANNDRALDPSNLDGPYTGDSGMLDGTRTVINSYGGFEDGLDGWNTNGGTLTIDSTHIHSGTAAGKFVPAGGVLNPFAATAWQTYTPGQTYQGSAWVWCTQACTVFASLHWYDRTAVFLGQSAATWTVPAGAWTPVSVTAIAPAGAVKGPLLVTLAGYPTSANVVWIDDAEVAHLPYAPATQVTAMRAIRARATWANQVYELFQGTADQWNVEYRDPGQSTTLLTATDGMKVLTGISRSPVPAVGDGESSGARIDRILDSAGWGAEERVVDAGDTTVQETTLEGEALAELQLVADSEIGELYVDGGGRVRFRARNALLTDARSAVSQAVFGDDGDELPYKDLAVATDDATFYNEVRVTRAARTVPEGDPPDEPVEQVASDTGSQAMFYRRTFTPSSAPILMTDADAAAYADWLVGVSSVPELRFTEITIEPAVQPAELWPQALGREIGDRITIIRRPPGGGDPIEMDCFIRGITHEFGGETWVTKWALQNAERYGGFLVLDDVLLGQLDGNRLAY